MKILYYNGDIITLENNEVEAVLADKNIIKCGSLAKLKKLIDQETLLYDLKGATLMPAFIDAHSHILSYAMSLDMTELTSAKTVEEIISIMKESQELNGWYIGYGYDVTLLDDHHPTKDDLNKISKDKPVILTERSGHVGVINSYLIDMLSENGIFQIENFDGVVFEEQLFKVLEYVPQLSKEQLFKNLSQAYLDYAKNGICTVQEGCCNKKQWKLLEMAAKKDLLILDTIAYFDIRDNEDIENEQYKTYNHHLKLGGYKVFLDGSPQNKTAWMKEKYLSTDDHGHPYYSYEQAKVYFRKAKLMAKQIIAHANGSAACKQMIELCKEVGNSYARPVMIHSQLLDISDMKLMKDAKIIASFLPSHIYYFGDTHLKNIGHRARYISPIASAIENGIVYTIHQDTPVFKPNLFEAIFCAVARTTRNNVVLDEEKITVLDALKAVTINAAYQYFEEDIKGSIKEGKNADFIILDKNPLKVSLDELKNIKILRTIKNNKMIYMNK